MDVHGRNEDSCCPCETKLQTAAKLVFPSLAGRPPLRVITRSKVFDATARKKARSYLHLKKFSTRRHGNANKYLYLANKWQNRISGPSIVFYRSRFFLLPLNSSSPFF